MSGLDGYSDAEILGVVRGEAGHLNLYEVPLAFIMYRSLVLPAHQLTASEQRMLATVCRHARRQATELADLNQNALPQLTREERAWATSQEGHALGAEADRRLDGLLTRVPPRRQSRVSRAWQAVVDAFTTLWHCVN